MLTFLVWGAYNLVCICKGDTQKKAFNTCDRHYEYLVMPFRLSNAQDVLQEFVNLSESPICCVVVYLVNLY